MTRKEFLEQALALGMSVPVLSMLLSACEEGDILKLPSTVPAYEGKVIIVGAGPAGITAGYILQRHNIDFEILEAASVYGGRLKRDTTLADFPIDLGAEWIHADPTVLAEVLNDPEANADLDFVTYNPQSIYLWKNDQLKRRNWVRSFYSEYKFKQSTWYGFFEQFMVPKLEGHLLLDHPVTSVSYAGDGVVVTTADGQRFEADRVLLTIPITQYQRGAIAFDPPLPAAKRNAINSIRMGDAMKVFIAFQERFYPDLLLFGGLLDSVADDDKIIYDAAFRKDAETHVLGIFLVGDTATPYTTMPNDEAVVQTLLGELDEIFDGQASEHYQGHVVQNWSNEPYIGGAYSTDFEGSYDDVFNALAEPVAGKLFFAGEALGYKHQATVHGACASAYTAIDQLVNAVS